MKFKAVQFVSNAEKPLETHQVELRLVAKQLISDMFELLNLLNSLGLVFCIFRHLKNCKQEIC